MVRVPYRLRGGLDEGAERSVAVGKNARDRASERTRIRRSDSSPLSAGCRFSPEVSQPGRRRHGAGSRGAADWFRPVGGCEPRCGWRGSAGVVGRVAVAPLDDGAAAAGPDVGDLHADTGRDAGFGASPLVFDPPLAISAGALLDEHVGAQPRRRARRRRGGGARRLRLSTTRPVRRRRPDGRCGRGLRCGEARRPVGVWLG